MTMATQLKQKPLATRRAGENSRQLPVGEVAKPRQSQAIRPSIDDQPFTLDQELVPFATWTTEPIWVPPKDSAREMAQTMLDKCSLLAPRADRWSEVIDQHRSSFTQVREIELSEASIRLPKGRLYVSITEQSDFDKITDKIPNCVKTRLEEFLQGPGRRHGTKVYYLKPLCVEVGDQLIFTTQAELDSTIEDIRDQVFAHYRRMILAHRTRRAILRAIDLAIALPRAIVKMRHESAKRKVDAYQARLEYNRRKLALRAANLHRKCRTDGCEYDEMLALTNPLERRDVVEQFGVEHDLSRAERDRLLTLTSITLPWFVTIPLAIYYASHFTLTLAPPIALCDPAFVAEMPGSRGVLLKIGHFDEVGGVTHVEI